MANTWDMPKSTWVIVGDREGIVSSVWAGTARWRWTFDDILLIKSIELDCAPEKRLLCRLQVAAEEDESSAGRPVDSMTPELRAQRTISADPDNACS